LEAYFSRAKVFRALSNPNRAMIVDMLSSGELCACMILEKFAVSQSTLSHHMKLLCECGLIRARNESKWTYYSLDRDTLGKIQEFFFTLTSDKENCIRKEESDCSRDAPMP